MFLRYSCGNACWHSNGYFANFTIDDPWLTEPYGNLSYFKLLQEMHKFDYHTTIAFIPWNFDRSKPEVVSLFRKNHDKYSICIHGNNHDHQEFYKYKTESNNIWQAKTLAVHEDNIKQALARMEKFRNLTNLSYDRVMIFPHYIAPSRTLCLLKKYNFLSTVNSNNIPLGSEKNRDAFSMLRRVTLQFESFPSFKRFSHKMKQSDIAIDLFLNNPLLFHAHQDLFIAGIDSFSKVAKDVNNICPDIKWCSLGDISRKWYLQRKRDNGVCEVRATSNNIIIENHFTRKMVYQITKDEAFCQLIKRVTVNDKSQSYEKTECDIKFTITIPPFGLADISIEYENNFDISSVDTSKNDFRVYLLRKLSDFRDMTLSKNLLGKAIIRVYYSTGLFKLGLKLSIIILFAIGAIISFIILLSINRYKKAN